MSSEGQPCVITHSGVLFLLVYILFLGPNNIYYYELLS